MLRPTSQTSNDRPISPATITQSISSGIIPPTLNSALKPHPPSPNQSQRVYPRNKTFAPLDSRRSSPPSTQPTRRTANRATSIIRKSSQIFSVQRHLLSLLPPSPPLLEACCDTGQVGLTVAHLLGDEALTLIDCSFHSLKIARRRAHVA